MLFRKAVDADDFSVIGLDDRCQPKSAVAVGGADFEDAFGVHGAEEECGDDVGGLRIEVEIADGMIGFGVIRFALLVEFFKEIDELGIHAVRLSSCPQGNPSVFRSRTCRSGCGRRVRPLPPRSAYSNGNDGKLCGLLCCHRRGAFMFLLIPGSFIVVIFSKLLSQASQWNS